LNVNIESFFGVNDNNTDKNFLRDLLNHNCFNSWP
jgi:hypothetical protein